MKNCIRDPLDVLRYPDVGCFKIDAPATAAIRGYAEDGGRFPLNRYAHVGIPDVELSPTSGGLPSRTVDFLPYRRGRYCFPYKCRPESVVECGAVAAARAMVVRVHLGAVLITEANWRGGAFGDHDVRGDGRPSILAAAATVRARAAQFRVMGVPVIVMNPNRARALGIERVENEWPRTLDGVDLAVECAVADPNTHPGTYLWPTDTAAVLLASDENNSTLRYCFYNQDRMAVESRIDDDGLKARIVEDYAIVLNPVFGYRVQMPPIADDCHVVGG